VEPDGWQNGHIRQCIHLNAASNAVEFIPDPARAVR
jgi:hypothetical protein